MMHARALLGGVAVAGILVLCSTAPALGEVVFYVDRHGSPDDSAHAAFCDAIGLPLEQDFEDPALGPDMTVLSSLPIGYLDLQLNCTLFDDTPLPPYLFSSPEFDVEGRFQGRALVVGTRLLVTVPQNQDVRAFGTWIFDDGRALDSAYLAQVTEIDGSVWAVLLENEIPLNVYGHEIEGFIGVFSDIGIRQVTITSVDPATGEAQPDGFEIDQVMAVGAVLPPGETGGGGDEDDGDDPDQGEDDDDDDCGHGHHNGGDGNHDCDGNHHDDNDGGHHGRHHRHGRRGHGRNSNRENERHSNHRSHGSH